MVNMAGRNTVLPLLFHDFKLRKDKITTLNKILI